MWEDTESNRNHGTGSSQRGLDENLAVARLKIRSEHISV